MESTTPANSAPATQGKAEHKSAGHPGPDACLTHAPSTRTRLVLVFPLNLKYVEEVGGCRVDLDQVLIWLRFRVWELCDFELMRPLRR